MGTKQSGREQVLAAAPPDEMDDALRDALSSALECALSFKEIASGPDKGFFTANYRVNWDHQAFESRLIGVESDFAPLTSMFTAFVNAIPAECSSFVEELSSNFLILIRNMLEVFRPLIVEFCNEEWLISGRVLGSANDAVYFCEELKAVGVERGVKLFYQQVGAQANLIVEQIEAYETACTLTGDDSVRRSLS